MPDIKPFRKTEHKVITLTIDEQGDVLFLASPENDVFLELGSVITRRASHVEPAGFWRRQAFHFLRLFGDKTRIAEWTRNWRCEWRVNTRPVGGPILRGHDYAGSWILTWKNRQDAIDAEIAFLNSWFLEH